MLIEKFRTRKCYSDILLLLLPSIKARTSVNSSKLITVYCLNRGTRSRSEMFQSSLTQTFTTGPLIIMTRKFTFGTRCNHTNIPPLVSWESHIPSPNGISKKSKIQNEYRKGTRARLGEETLLLPKLARKERKLQTTGHPVKLTIETFL